MRMKESIYSTYKGKKYLGDFTPSELYKMVGIKPVTLYSYVNKELVFRGTYTFKKGKKDNLKDMTTEEILEEWDKVRKWLNPEAV